MNGISDQLAKDDHDRVLRQKILPATDLDSLTSHERPRAIILGGQPGAGKGGLVDMAREHFGHDVLVIDPDEMRAFHPQVEEFRRQNPVEWAGRTHLDASPWATEVLDVASSDRKALILDKTLANGESASALIGELQAKGYDVEVRVVAAHKLESELGVDNRFTAQIDKEGYGRHVPKAARDAIYESIPSSLDTIQRTTSAPISIYNR
ncbi:zeta toxin family protein [Stenotrophomonas sp.]|uniref:zeta toxin family protein n=1 Tax=Stenotrophomonas sp. TaxID=69392 RepID=UPI0028A26DF4|nr:zeta toxin family protein [Stenotrophomonas sp.]